MRELYAAERERTAAARLEVTTYATQVARLHDEAQDAAAMQVALRESLAAAGLETAAWKHRARRRWWTAAGLVTLLTGGAYLSLPH